MKHADAFVWIGLFDDTNGGDWHWIDGTELSYTNWFSLQPTNKDEHCVDVSFSTPLLDLGLSPYQL